MPRRSQTNAKVSDVEREFKKVFKRLHESNGRLQRKRARSEFRTFTKKILDDYPLLDTNNQEIVPKKSVVLCPICKVPLSTWLAFVKHLGKIHWIFPHGVRVSKEIQVELLRWLMDAPVEMPCPTCLLSVKGAIGFAHHYSRLAKKNELTPHIIIAASKVVFSQKGTP